MLTSLSQTKQWLATNQTTAFWLKTLVGANLIALFAQIAIP